jgi:peptidoglycan hydrolase-like protein with peptidoglycan-binding domain
MRRRRVRLTLTAGAALLVIVPAILIAGTLGGSRDGSGAEVGKSHATSVTTVVRGPLSSQLSVNGTLTYSTRPEGLSYTLVNEATGIYTDLPVPGRTAARGQVLYRVSNSPVVLLYGRIPTYRALAEGDSGPDVRQLNRNLVALGDVTTAVLDPSSDRFGPATVTAVERLQSRLGEIETGMLAAGQVVFFPGPIRIAAVRATLGAKAHRATSIALATSTAREVVANLDASDQTAVEVGDAAQVTLPTGETAPGVVRAIGTITGSGASGPVVPVYVALKRAKVASTLAQAPVQVEITTDTVRRALIVPVDALMARSGGGYMVETLNPRGLHRLASVRLGMFDDADGTVQIHGALRAGERIVVPNA